VAEPARKVLDTWAVIAWLRDESGAARVERLWAEAAAGKLRLLMSAVNIGEVFYITARWRSLTDAEIVMRHLQELPLEICPAPNTLIWGAARVKAQHRLSYADAFAVATALRESATLVTGDPEVRAVGEKGVVRVEWIGTES
jgi:predicted nucleic acid-binding protein